MKQKYLSIILIFLISNIYTTNTCAQLNSVFFGSSPKEGNYCGQRAENGEKAGIGILDLGNNMLYAGDFMRNKPEGKGIIISDNGSNISNCKDAYFYYGSWIKGKKDGKGICYDRNGNIIYEGSFSNDKPIDKYPSNLSIDNRSFGVTQDLDGNKIISQIKDNLPNGFGIGLFNDGLFWIGKFKNGHRIGTGLMYSPGDEWVIVQFNGDSSKEITSSKNYYAHKSSHDNSWRQLKYAIQDQFTQGITQLLHTQYSSIKEQSNPSVAYPNETKNNINEVNFTIVDDENGNDNVKEKNSPNKHNKEIAQKHKEAAKQAEYASLHRRESQRALDAIMDEILDRKNNPEKYFYESNSKFKSNIKKLQKEAKNILNKFKENSGGQKLSVVTSLLNWEP